MVRTYDPENYNTAPHYQRRAGSRWSRHFAGEAAWRWYLLTAISLNIILSFVLIGSLQQIYTSVKSLSSLVGDAINVTPLVCPQTSTKVESHKPIK